MRCLCVAAVLVWILLARTLTYARSRAVACLPLPPRWRNNASSISGRSPSAPSFVLLWSTNESSFTLRSRRCVESIFFHHPRASVRVYSNKLPKRFFSEFRQHHFDVRVVRYDVERLLRSTPAAPWLERLSEWEAGPFFYSHVTDAVRLALLFRVGGVYLDTDVLLARPIRLAPPSRAEGATTRGMQPPTPSSMATPSATPRPLHDALGIESYADPRIGGPVLNGAVMAFARGSRFLWNCLHEFGADYQPGRWGWNGPELLTRVQARCADADGARVQVEPPEAFYPLYWDGVASYADGLPQHAATDSAMWATIERSSYAVHVWNRKAAELTFARGSLLHRLHNTWMVLPDRSECI